MKTIILLTNMFPYGKAESFISDELNYIPSDAEFYLFPISAIENGEKRKVPPNIKIMETTSPRISDRLLSVMETVVSKTLWEELRWLAKNRKICAITVKRALAYLFTAKLISKKLGKIISKIEIKKDCDEIILYSYWLSPAAIATLLSKQYLNKKIFCVSRCHGIDIYQYRHQSNYLPYRKKLYEEVDLICPISENGLQYIMKTFEGQNKYLNVKVSRLGTADRGFVSNNTIKKDVLNIVTCSAVISVKRLDRLVNCLMNIKDINIHWVHFGNGVLYNEIKNMCEKLPFNIQYDFRGQMGVDEIIACYLQEGYHLFVNVSESEGIPVSIMEALSCGLPVAATDVGGTCEVIEKGKNGYLMQENDIVKELSSIFHKVLEMPDSDYLKLRQGARLKWKEICSAEKNYCSFYKNLMDLIC